MEPNGFCIFLLPRRAHQPSLSLYLYGISDISQLILALLNSPSFHFLVWGFELDPGQNIAETEWMALQELLYESKWDFFGGNDGFYRHLNLINQSSLPGFSNENSNIFLRPTKWGSFLHKIWEIKNIYIFFLINLLKVRRSWEKNQLATTILT